MLQNLLLICTTEPLSCSAPTIDNIVAGTVDLSIATVDILGPSQAPPGGWTKYNISVCPVKPAGSCTFQTCTPVKAPPALTSCTLTGLNQNTTYWTWARAVQGSIVSERSAGKYFRTLLQE